MENRHHLKEEARKKVDKSSHQNKSQMKNQKISPNLKKSSL